MSSPLCAEYPFQVEQGEARLLPECREDARADAGHTLAYLLKSSLSAWLLLAAVVVATCCVAEAPVCRSWSVCSEFR